MGYRVVVGESCDKVYGHLSGDDEVRSRDLNRMFLDDCVDAIFCIRGGYGSARLLDRLDFRAVREHPKVFAGFSDITALHAAFHKFGNLVTFHAPMPTSNWIDEDFTVFSLNSMLRTLSDPAPLGELVNPEGYPRTTVVGGRCEGRLVGGNLSLVAGLLGTPWQLDVRGKITLYEQVKLADKIISY